MIQMNDCVIIQRLGSLSCRNTRGFRDISGIMTIGMRN